MPNKRYKSEKKIKHGAATLVKIFMIVINEWKKLKVVRFLE